MKGYLTSTFILLLSAAAVAGTVAAKFLGEAIGTSLATCLIAAIYAIGSCATYAVVLFKDRRWLKDNAYSILSLRETMKDYAKQFNITAQMLKDSYDDEVSRKHTTRQKRQQLRKRYSERYEALRKDIEARSDAARDQQLRRPDWIRRYWQWAIVAGIVGAFTSCGFSVGTCLRLGNQNDNNGQKQQFRTTSPRTTTRKAAKTTVWTAATIPMPHLDDARQWVSNPDSLISQETTDRLNEKLCILNDSLGIETVMVIVGRVKNQDVFRFAQDLFDIYGIGRDDRGLVVVLAVDDRMVRSHTGRSLEADLTDVELSRLQKTYIVKAMKQNRPEEGLLNFTDALIATLSHKEMPQPAATLAASNEDPLSAVQVTLGIYALFVMFWLIVCRRLSLDYGLEELPLASLMANPFAPSHPSYAAGPVIFGSGGGGSHSSDSGWFGGFGGGFGGGSSGGGGATSSW